MPPVSLDATTHTPGIEELRRYEIGYFCVPGFVYKFIVLFVLRLEKIFRDYHLCLRNTIITGNLWSKCQKNEYFSMVKNEKNKI